MSDNPNPSWISEWSSHLGALAHEMKNPLSTMRINLELLREEWGAEKSPQAQRSVQKIDVLLRESERLEEMLRTFMKAAQHAQADFQRQDVNLLIEQILEFMAAELARKGVVATSQLDGSLPRLEVDQNLFKQALMNLVKNALDAIGEAGGVITIQTMRDGDDAVIHVIDTGSGMSPETLQQAFSPYFSTKQKGTGLGLSSVKRIINQHGGSITGESALHRGTRFTIRLPIERRKR